MLRFRGYAWFRVRVCVLCLVQPHLHAVVYGLGVVYWLGLWDVYGLGLGIVYGLGLGVVIRVVHGLGLGLGGLSLPARVVTSHGGVVVAVFGDAATL